jgi:preprotein translocase subunit SecA
MAADEVEDSVAAIRDEVVESMVAQYIPPGSLEEQWDPEDLAHAIEHDFMIQLDVPQWIRDDPKMNEEGIRDRCIREINAAYEEKERSIGSRLMRHVEKEVMLKQLDFHWKEHLAAMDYLRQGIHLRGYAQKNPKQEYKREAFAMFGAMLDQVKHDTVSILSRVRVQSEEDIQRMEEQRRMAQAMEFQHAQASALGQGLPAAARVPGGAQGAPPAAAPQAPFVRDERKVGRNEPCPCGSGSTNSATAGSASSARTPLPGRRCRHPLR